MSKYCFGVDLGGTTVKIGLFDPEGTVLEKWEIPTRKENNGSNILPDIAAAVLGKMEEKNIQKEEVIGVGIGVPGPVNDEGVIFKAVNLGWDVMNISEVLGGLLQLPVKAGNDANVAALGEMWCGGGKGYDRSYAYLLYYVAYASVFRTEVMPPFRDTMRFIYGIEGDFHILQEFHIIFLCQRFRCHIEQLGLSAQDIGLHLINGRLVQ